MEQKEEIAQKLLLGFDDLDLAIMHKFWLRNAGLKTVADIVRHTEADFKKKFGHRTVLNVKDILTSMGLTFGMDVGAYIEEPPKESFLYKITSAIIGGAIGDALGVPYEFKKRDTFKATDMIGGGTHNQPVGTWSDDTSLTLCLMENIAEGGDCDALMRKFSDWHKNGYMTPHGKCFDDGHTTFAAIKAFGKGTPANQCGQSGEDDNGNGSLMRIAPVALMNIENYSLGSRLENIKKYSSITHAHPRAVLGCTLYSEYLRLVYFWKSKDVTGILCDIAHSPRFGGIYDWMPECQSEFSHYKRILEGDIYKLKRDDIQSDGYVVHTLEAALWCFLRNDNFKDTVLEAVNLGGDTDTTAIVAGSMAGLYYGLENIPEEWRKSLAKYDEIIKLCSRFYSKITWGTFTDQRDGKIYKTVKIDDMTWLAENFNYEGEGKYDFETAKKICPKGWHLPSFGEWNGLIEYVCYTGENSLDFYIPKDSDEEAGRYLKAKEGWKDHNGKSGNGEDTFGFAALPEGSSNFQGPSIGLYGLWWSATKCDDENLVWTFSMRHDSDEVQRCNTWLGDKLSVRYVKDE